MFFAVEAERKNRIVLSLHEDKPEKSTCVQIFPFLPDVLILLPLWSVDEILAEF